MLLRAVDALRQLWSSRSQTSCAVQSLERQPELIAAVGDVHGRLDLLQKLEREVLTRAEAEVTFIYLGDFIDRGPSSAAVIDTMISRRSGLRRLAIMGNHEFAMLNFMRRPSISDSWLDFGGRETLLSYGIPADRLDRTRGGPRRHFEALVHAYIPHDHLDFLAALPMIIETPQTICVHSCINPRLPIANQDARYVLESSAVLEQNYEDLDRDVVHGHMIVPEPSRQGRRISIDTGAYKSGKLSAALISRAGSIEFVSVTM